MSDRIKSIDEGYQPDFPGQQLVDIDPTPSDASVDGQGGTIRDKPVFTIEEAAYYLNRGDGLITFEGQQYESGAEWFGAQGTARNDWYFLPESKVDNDGTLNTLSFGFYETQLSLPEPYLIRLPNGALVAGMGQTAGFSAFSADQRAATREAIAVWDDLIAVDFVETHFSEGDINFMNTTSGPIQASAYLPYDYGVVRYTNGQPVVNFDGEVVTNAEISGDIYVNPNQPSNRQFDEGQYGLTTLIHELGHSLGLEHPGAYNFGPGFDLTYVGAAEYYQDSNQYSIMSYWGAHETGAAHINWNNLTFIYASTPMVHDIAAIQRIYGADTTTRTGDTVYGFNSTAGNDSFDFEATPMPVVAIWDAGGEDTLDFSGWDSNSSIDLNPGSYSSGGGSGLIPLAQLKANGVLPATYTEAQYASLLARYNSPDGLLHDNISIAYGAWIENAVGGGGDDLIIANDVANVIDGGDGSDTVSYQASDAGVRVELQDERRKGRDDDDNRGHGKHDDKGRGNRDDDDRGKGHDKHDHNGKHDHDRDDEQSGGYAEDDYLISIENVVGSAFDDRLSGNDRANTLSGGAGDDRLDGGDGDDVLDGGAGDDELEGGDDGDVLNGGAGNDELEGGDGRDTFAFTDLGGTDEVKDFRRGHDKIDLSDLDAILDNEGHDAFAWVGKDAFSNTAGELRTYKHRGDNFLAGDVDGDGVADFVIAFGEGPPILQSDVIFG